MAAGRDRRGLGGRLALVLGAALTLGLAAAALNAAHGSALAGDGPVKSHWLLMIAAVVAVGWVLVVRLRRREDRDPATERPSEGRMDALTIPGIAVMALLTAVALAVLGTRTHGIDPPPPPPPTPSAQPSLGDGKGATPTFAPAPQPGSGSGTGRGSGLPLSTLLTGFVWLLAAALVITLVVLLSRWVMARRRNGAVEESFAGAPVPGADGLAEAVDAGRQALAEDPDPRAAIIACYAAMEESLAAGGVNRLKADTPADLLERTVSAGAAPEEAARTLTELFREARYSSHPMGEHQRDQAQAALAAIAAHLAAVAAAADERFGPREELSL